MILSMAELEEFVTEQAEQYEGDNGQQNLYYFEAVTGYRNATHRYGNPYPYQDARN